MTDYTIVGFFFAILIGLCSFGCAARDRDYNHRYQQMLDEHEDAYDNINC